MIVPKYEIRPAAYAEGKGVFLLEPVKRGQVLVAPDAINQVYNAEQRAALVPGKQYVSEVGQVGRAKGEAWLRGLPQASVDLIVEPTIGSTIAAAQMNIHIDRLNLGSQRLCVKNQTISAATDTAHNTPIMVLL